VSHRDELDGTVGEKWDTTFRISKTGSRDGDVAHRRAASDLAGASICVDRIAGGGAYQTLRALTGSIAWFAARAAAQCRPGDADPRILKVRKGIEVRGCGDANVPDTRARDEIEWMAGGEAQRDGTVVEDHALARSTGRKAGITTAQFTADPLTTSGVDIAAGGPEAARIIADPWVVDHGARL